jgi:hypothetical protein
MRYCALSLFAFSTAMVLISQQGAAADCRPADVPGKHGTTNVYRVALDGDRAGHDISQSIWVTFRMFDDGRIEALLKYDNATREPLCGGVHIRLGDADNNAIADFYSNPYWCVNGQPDVHPARENAGDGETYTLSLMTTAAVACRYAHLYIEPNYTHRQTVAP